MNALLQELERRASQSPDSTVLQGPENSLNVSEFLALVRETVLRLSSGGCQTVALLAENCPEWVIVDLACQLEGICLVPVPTFFSREQVRHVLQSAGADLLVCQEGLEDRIPGDVAAFDTGVSLLPGLRGLSLSGESMARIPQGTSKVTFTSGSTGTPKGVCLSFEQCLNVAGSVAKATGLRSPRHLCVLPLPVLLENIAGIYAPLLVGGQAITLPLESLGFSGSSGIDPARFLAALERYQPSTLILVPQLLELLDVALAHGWTPPPSLRFIAVGGARVAPSLVERARAGGLPVYEGYGLSECASVVSLNRPGCDRPGTSGQVLDHVRVAEQAGQLRVIGNTFLGYLNQPETWYADHVDTGDIGTIDTDGYVSIQGRATNLLINSFGRNISPEWVESELAGSGVFRQAVVFGDGRPFCTALVYPFDPDCADSVIQAAIDKVNRSLPDYARIGAWARLPSPLTQADGMLTSNGRLCREPIESAYGHLIQSLYEQTAESVGL